VGPIQSIKVDPMKSGGLGVVYRSPDKGRVSLYLYNDGEDILLVVDARFDWRGEQNVLVLNSKFAGGEWGPEVRPEGFPFPCCGYVTTITVRVEIGADGFTLSANGIEIVKYPYRDGLPPPVTKFQYVFQDQGASETAQLESLSAYY
uniref:GALECTIN n=1 Tax=Cinachyrella TaxID=76781 RepID=UPI00027B2C31|nr:Chain A, GALECTIN [Cinachyrella]4AGG_B Chain B, GALECTIN [Cinachyrella]4AGR_A Chain A, GALECTIN [Cinachyrella]4AGR_B Chain B, GALECTIN [Cinachyrella]4AGR_C Chain C, GALECTIN [Cinachyrella]4AGR_D Chain D, GALECTIN [Cinachyrella]4AGV_A Chain A, GALECTIN [Cinachyrella]4AGV_B Chain B, GALECTIN [Cinachyrella]4AGV_C Chain C, GALECTIN [Cinachyrella]4AGV_D Chain D, GALECTIN [Cinachyrella]